MAATHPSFPMNRPGIRTIYAATFSGFFIPGRVEVNLQSYPCWLWVPRLVTPAEPIDFSPYELETLDAAIDDEDGDDLVDEDSMNGDSEYEDEFYEKIVTLRMMSMDEIEAKDEDGESKICAICHEELCHHCGAGDELIGVLGCRHEYHGSCIRKWLALNNSCPVCRARVEIEDQDWESDTST